MSKINDNSTSSLNRSHPNKGLTLENLSMKVVNKKLNKSLNSSNNSFYKNNLKNSNKNRLSDTTSNKSKKSKNPNENLNSLKKQNIKKQSSNLSLNNTNESKIKYEEDSLNYITDITVDNYKYLTALNETLNFIENNEINILNNITENLEKILEITLDENKNIRLGALIILYLVLKKNFNEIKDEEKLIILKQIISLLQTYEKQDELFLLSCLEICSLFGQNDILIDNLGIICMFLTDFNFPKLQRASFNCLMSIGFIGIKTLIELASKDEQDYQLYILNQLIHTPHIQRIILISAIFNELYSNDYKSRNIALSAINRLNILLNDEDSLQKLNDLFNEPKINCQFIASILRNKEGEKYLLYQLKNNKNPNIRAAICSVLCYRLPKKYIPIKIKLDTNETSNINLNIPGKFYTYYGKITPIIVPPTKNLEEILENEEFNLDENYPDEILKILGIVNETSEDILVISSRDLLAALQRMIQIQYEHNNPQLVFDENNLFNSLDHLKIYNNPEDNKELELVIKYISIFNIEKENNPLNSQTDISEYFENKFEYISEDIIKSLGKALSDFSPKVRESAAMSLGVIGLPESVIAIDYMIQNLNDDDVNVKSKIIWSIGRISQLIENSVIPNIFITLQSNMWKVKKASLYALSQFGDRCDKNIIPYLINLLKESAINKQLIAETIVKLGIEGENALLLLMSSESDNNYKLKSAIIKGYAYTDIHSPNIDFILESIFKQCNNEFSLVRKSCIFTIHELAEKAQENITYLKKKNIIPFYYEKLKDKDINIQGYAINCIKNLGAEGELIFIEGFMKDKNYLIRINCGLGLADIGIQNMRTLLLGLQDKNQNVRNTIEKVIIVKMPISDVVEYFNNINQLDSLKITVKDLLEKKQFLQVVTVGYLEKLMDAIEECQSNMGKNLNNINSDNYEVVNNQAEGEEGEEEEQKK